MPNQIFVFVCFLGRVDEEILSISVQIITKKEKRSYLCRVEVAELVEVWWLDIKGRLPVKDLRRSACYGAFFVFKLNCNSDGLESAYASLRFVDEDGRRYGDDDGVSVVYIDNRRRGIINIIFNKVFVLCRPLNLHIFKQLLYVPHHFFITPFVPEIE